MFFLRVSVLFSFIFSFASSQGWAPPPIETLDDVKTLVNKGITHQNDFYSVQTFPHICSTSEISIKGAWPMYQGVVTHCSFQYFYDGYDHNTHQGEDRSQAPRTRYLDLVEKAQARFKGSMLNDVFIVEVASEDTSLLPTHYLIPRRTKLAKEGANAQQIEMEIRARKLGIQSEDIRAAEKEISFLQEYMGSNALELIRSYGTSYTDNQWSFVQKSLGIMKEPNDNYNVSSEWNPRLNSHVVVPFKDYLASLPKGEKVKVLVGRGQLSSTHELYNQPLLSSSIVLPSGYHPYTIDCDPRQIAHLIANITNADHLKEIPNDSVDEFYFDGVTYETVYWPGSGLYEILRDKLKVGGRFITTYCCPNFTRSAKKLLNYGFGEIQTLDPQEDHFHYSNEVKYVTKLK